jgi:hypothetical protein
MCVKFSIPACGVSSFMDSSAGIWGWHMCEKDTEYRNRFGLQRINIKIAIYMYDYCKTNVKYKLSYQIRCHFLSNQLTNMLPLDHGCT